MMNTMGYARRYLSASRESELSALRELLTSGALLSGISALIHALQRERGASTLWLCAEASLTAEALTARRQEADQALAAMIDLLPTPQRRADGSRFYNRAALALHALSGLSTLRAQVRQRQLPHAEAMQQFSEIIRHLLHLIVEAADTASDPQMSRALLALFSFMQGKELAGQERALGAAGFAAGAFSRTAQRQLIALLEGQDRSFATFVQFADDDSLRAWRAVAEAGQEIEKLRRIACGGMTTRGVEAQRWFRLLSERLDAMKQIEERLEQRILIVCRRCIERIDQAEDDDWPTAHVGLGYSLYVAAAPWLEEGDGALDAGGVAPQLSRSLLTMLEQQAQRLQAQSDELAAMRVALTQRKEIERAKALLMQHHQCDEEQAWHTLRKMAMNQNKRVWEIAQALVAVSSAFSLTQKS